MLSYQHAYHAGNAADVHKHLALVMLLGRLRQKEAPFCFVDSHAGRGIYDLKSAEAEKTGEAAQGIQKLLGAQKAPAPVREYLDLVAATFDPRARAEPSGGARRQDLSATGLRWYPGSAALARALLREQDRAILLELHPQEQVALRTTLGRDRRIAIHDRDCFEGLPALLPPPIRRGLALIDPSYEEKDEYLRIAALLSQALPRWPNGIFLLWYPLLADERHRALERALAELALPKTVVSEFRFSTTAVGLQGSALVIVNAPWQFADEFAAAMDPVCSALSPDRGHHQIRERDAESSLGRNA